MQKDYDVAIVRIVGNELPPRHRPGSNIEQLLFILKNESLHPKVNKIWLLNRIVDTEQERALIAILEKHHCAYVRLPFDLDQYKVFLQQNGYTKPRIWFKKWQGQVIAKAGFIIDINRARNKTMDIGAEYANWIMPLDGGCCLNTESLSVMLDTIIAHPERDAYALPTYRLVDNCNYTNFDPRCYPMHESMLLLKHTLRMPFDESIPYGKGEKLKTIIKLFPRSAMKRTVYAYLVNDSDYHAGYVVRLSSGMDNAEGKYRKRVKLRVEGLSRLVEKVDELARQAQAL
jgi:hypothetical protein